ncbi:diguanylate cyclase, partial [Bacillota bacterium LX-D]|nr:diguanylate cyclase [Bacillota bacterium LX-D]
MLLYQLYFDRVSHKEGRRARWELFDAYEELTYGNEPISLLFIDIDFFKKVNDTYGHKEG